MSVSMLERGPQQAERDARPQAPGGPRGVRRPRPGRRRRRRELQRRHRRPASASGTTRRSEINPRDRLSVDQRLRRRRARQGDGHDLPGAERPDDDAGERRRPAGAQRRPVRRPRRPALRRHRDALGALHARADGPRPARRRRPARRAHLAGRDRAVGHDGARRDRDANGERRAAARARSGSSRRHDGYVAALRARPMPSRAASSRRSARPALVEDERFSSRDRRVANAAELHALDRRLGGASSRLPRQAVARLDGARRSGGGRPRHRDRRPRPAGAPRAARRCRSLTPSSGRSTISTGAASRSGSPRRDAGYDDARRRRLGEHNDFVLGGAARLLAPSGSRRCAPPALSKAAPPSS